MHREVLIVCSDGKCAIDVSSAGPSRLLASIIDDTPAEKIEISTPDFDVATMLHVVEFLDHHRTEPFADVDPPLRQSLDELVDSWDRNYLVSLQQGGNMLPVLAVLEAATYMDIPPLKSLCAACIAQQVQITSDDDLPGLFGVAQLTDKQISAACAPFPWLQDGV